MLKEKEKQNNIQKMRKLDNTRKICLQPWINGIRVAGST